MQCVVQYLLLMVCTQSMVVAYHAQVGCDGPDDMFRMLNTSNSYEGHDILRKHIATINSLVSAAAAVSLQAMPRRSIL